MEISSGVLDYGGLGVAFALIVTLGVVGSKVVKEAFVFIRDRENARGAVQAERDKEENGRRSKQDDFIQGLVKQGREDGKAQLEAFERVADRTTEAIDENTRTLNGLCMRIDRHESSR